MLKICLHVSMERNRIAQRPDEATFHSYFYAPEAHIMYLTVVSWFLISFVMGRSGPSRANKFLYAPAPPPPSVWALKPPLWALVHKTTYAPMNYTALCIMFWMRAYPLLGQVGGDWALEISSILGPKWHSPIGSMPFHRAQKLKNSRAQPPPTCPS